MKTNLAAPRFTEWSSPLSGLSRSVSFTVCRSGENVKGSSDRSLDADGSIDRFGPRVTLAAGQAPGSLAARDGRLGALNTKYCGLPEGLVYGTPTQT